MISDREEPCPTCDHDLWHPGHVHYTYAEWYDRIRRNTRQATGLFADKETDDV